MSSTKFGKFTLSSSNVIVYQLTSLKKSLESKKNGDLSEVIESPSSFFRELHAVFSRFRIDNHNGLLILLKVVFQISQILGKCPVLI